MPRSSNSSFRLVSVPKVLLVVVDHIPIALTVPARALFLPMILRYLTYIEIFILVLKLLFLIYVSKLEVSKELRMLVVDDKESAKSDKKPPAKKSSNRPTTSSSILLSETSETAPGPDFGISVGGGAGKKGKVNSMDTTV